MTTVQRLKSMSFIMVYLNYTQAMAAPRKRSATSHITEQKAKQLLGWPQSFVESMETVQERIWNPKYQVGKGEACGVYSDRMVFCKYPYTCSHVDGGTCLLYREQNDYDSMSPQELEFIEDLYDDNGY